jgi:hypothetical protein
MEIIHNGWFSQGIAMPDPPLRPTLPLQPGAPLKLRRIPRARTASALAWARARAVCPADQHILGGEQFLEAPPSAGDFGISPALQLKMLGYCFRDAPRITTCPFGSSSAKPKNLLIFSVR